MINKAHSPPLSICASSPDHYQMDLPSLPIPEPRRRNKRTNAPMSRPSEFGLISHHVSSVGEISHGLSEYSSHLPAGHRVVIVRLSSHIRPWLTCSFPVVATLRPLGHSGSTIQLPEPLSYIFLSRCHRPSSPPAQGRKSTFPRSQQLSLSIAQYVFELGCRTPEQTTLSQLCSR